MELQNSLNTRKVEITFNLTCLLSMTRGAPLSNHHVLEYHILVTWILFHMEIVSWTSDVNSVIIDSFFLSPWPRQAVEEELWLRRKCYSSSLLISPVFSTDWLTHSMSSRDITLDKTLFPTTTRIKRLLPQTWVKYICQIFELSLIYFALYNGTEEIDSKGPTTS